MSIPVRVLLAEDNPGDVVLVRDALQQQSFDFELVVVDNGDKMRSFLDTPEDNRPGPDVLLLDLNLPRVDGPDMFRLLRDHPCCSNVPLIVITSSDSPRDRAWTEEFGVAHYFRKPSNYDAFMKLGELVRSVVGNNGPTQ
jgi:chemotaxis family two-component system response regulator Rcp1